jgi:hypothetical protein
VKRRSCVNYKHKDGCVFKWDCDLPCDSYKLRRKRKSRLYKINCNKSWETLYDKEIKRLGLDK